MSHVEEGTLHAMLDGELAGEEIASLKAHLDTCAQCRALLDEVKEFVAEADTLIVTLDETALADEGGQAVRRTGGQASGKAVGRYGGNVRPWYRQPQFLAAAATITLAIGAGYIGLALRDQGLLTDQPELLSEAGVPPARVDGPVVDSIARNVAQEESAEALALETGAASKDEVAEVAGELRKQAEPSAAESEREEEQPAMADTPAPAAPAARAARADSPDAIVGGRIANEGNVAAADPPADDGLDEAMSRLGASIKLIDGHRPVRIEQEPAPALEGATAGGGLVRVVYQDEEDREFVLEQVKVSFDNDAADDKRNRAVEAQQAAPVFADRDSFLRITPNDTVISAETDSTVRIRWVDADGILLALIGVDEAFLREMMARIN